MNRYVFPFFALLLTCLGWQPLAGQYLSGYGHALQGETIDYESQQPDAQEALLVRSLEQRKYIEWETDTVPRAHPTDTVEFIMIAGIDVNPENNHSFRMFIDGEHQFTFRNPLDTLTTEWQLEGRNGVSLRMKGVMIDKYGDLFSYLFLSVPAGQVRPGRPVTIRVEGESAGSRSWFMVFKYTAVQQVKFRQEEALVRQGDAEQQLVRIDLLHFAQPALATIQIGKSRHTLPVELGFNMVRIPVEKVESPTTVTATVRLNDREIANTELLIRPVEPKTIYLLPHSHHDIGYTHVQEEVEAIQWQNIRDAVAYSERTSDYPAGSRFRWNSEVMWAVQSYLKQCTEDERALLENAVRSGSFELNGFYANLLTGLCRPGELYRMMEHGVKVADAFGVELRSAMITDIPGYTWGIVPAMAQSGIRYFSIGTNTFHRIGDIIETWGDKPFYWESPSGKEKVLCWVHGKGYSEFHTGLAYTLLRNKLKEQLIFDYIHELAGKGYPYDLVTMRYNIGSDNGPPDPHLSDIVRNWNERYSSPRLVISTVTEAFGLFEEKYGSSLPTYRGDLTGYWEDGAASSAVETAINLASAERLTQAATLHAITDPGAYPAGKFDMVWEQVLLFNEHTWGSWNSISEPDSPFTRQQWNTKRSFARNAQSLSAGLLSDAVPASAAETATQVDVFNTSSWERTDLVTVPATYRTRGDRVRDEEGTIIPSQRLAGGELVFVAEGLPPFSSRRYFFEPLPEPKAPGDETDEQFFPYSHITLDLDEADGSIRSLKLAGMGGELVGDLQHGLNRYLYVEGRRPVNAKEAGQSSVVLAEEGPVLRKIRIESEAPGCDGLVREITFYQRLDRIDITNTLDKKDILDPEGVHFVFPLRVDGGKVRISNAWGYYQVEKEQMPGANRNFVTANRWADVSGREDGITLVTLDAPLFEIGGITCDPIEYGWVDSLPPTQTLVSYVMNNYWETNYLASQPGKAVFRYSLYPHGAFDPVEAERRGIERHQPLLPVITDRFMPVPEAGFRTIVPDRVIIEGIRPLEDGCLLVSLYNPGPGNEVLQFDRQGGKKIVYLCDPFGRQRVPIEEGLDVGDRDVVHVLIESR